MPKFIPFFLTDLKSKPHQSCFPSKESYFCRHWRIPYYVCWKKFLLFPTPNKSRKLWLRTIHPLIPSNQLSFEPLFIEYFCDLAKKASTPSNSQSLNYLEKQRLQCPTSPNSSHIYTTHASFEVFMVNNEDKDAQSCMDTPCVLSEYYTQKPSLSLRQT